MSWLFALQLRPFVLLAACASLFLNLALLVPALYMVQVFDRVFASRSVETLVMLSLLVVLALALGYCMDVARARALAFAGRLLDARLSPASLRRALAAAASPKRTTDADSLRDVAQLRSFLSGAGVLALFDAPWLPIYLLVIGLMHPALGIAATIAACTLAALGVTTERATRTATEAARLASRASHRHAQSLMRNAEVIAGMGMTGAAVASWGRDHAEVLSTQQRLAGTSARLAAAARILRQLLQAGLLGLGAWLVINAHASPGIMVAATILLGRALQPVELLIAGWKALLEARSAWRRLNARESASAQPAPLALPAPRGRIALEGVVFGNATPRSPLIKGISFVLEAGESLGIIGPSAAGKTTLLRLILGVWRPQAGTVRLDGADVAQWDRDALGASIGYLPQDVELFAGTVAENIARLGHVNPEQVVAAARTAHAHEMILALPQGYDTPVGEAGAVLSGGQRQRIALARALYGEPRVVVLDEPNANLDAEGDAALIAALRELKGRDVTVIIVSHRPSAMAQLDKLAVLKDGTLVHFGDAATFRSRLQPVARGENGAQTGSVARTTNVAQAGAARAETAMRTAPEPSASTPQAQRRPSLHAQA